MGGGATPDGWNTVGGRPSMRGERQTIDPARLKLSRVRVIVIGQKNEHGQIVNSHENFGPLDMQK